MNATSELRTMPDGSDGDSADKRCDAPFCDMALEADHRIANHLAMLSGYVRLKQSDLIHRSEPLTSTSIQLAFDGIRTQLEAVSRLHRALVTRRQGALIDLGEYLHQVCAPFTSGLSGAITLSENLHPGCYVHSDQILPLTQIVSEVITNAIKYSHARGQPGAIAVNCRVDSEGELEIEVIDDGTGLPQLLDPLTAGGLGFRLIRALTAQVGAQSGFESSRGGTRFWLRVSAAAAQATGPE